jgi:C-terminal processing protease CtpA/Prc
MDTPGKGTRWHRGNFMRALVCFSVLAVLAACGSSDGGGNAPPADTACSINEQKQFVLDVARDWYLWNDLLPAQINVDDYATPEALLADIRSYSPGMVDAFSAIGSLQADQEFFGEGKFEGFGFSSRFEAAGDLRLTRVFADSPAALGGLARGQRILELNGRTIAEIQAAEGVSAVLDQSPLEFKMREIDGGEFTVTIEQAVVTIDPVPQWRLIPRTGLTPVGYVEFAQFISTADPQLEQVFAEFRANGVTDVIVDLRYNGGGLVSTAELFGDYLGGDVAENLIFSETRYNADRAERLGNSISLEELVIVATGSTASASELVTNGMEPHVSVTIVGDSTFGKPIGQSGFDFCEQRLRLTSFQIFNADGFGDYFDGLAADCAANDDLNVAVGADSDPNMVAALSYLNGGGCPVIATPADFAKPGFETETPQLEFADAF